MRRFRSRRAAAPRKPKDYVWVTAIFSQFIAESTTTVSLASAGTWEANSLNFERATLLRVRGWITLAQTAAGSSAASPYIAMAMHKGPLTFSAGDFSPFTSSDYDATDVLWTFGVSLGGIAFSSYKLDVAGSTIPVDVKAKRRMDSSEQVLLTFGMSADAGATPQAAVSGCLRLLINRA